MSTARIKSLTYTIPEVSTVLGIGRDAAYALARSGKIPVIKIGQRYLIPKEALHRWLNEESLPNTNVKEGR
jgi:excisionase family DNA binding protein